MFTMTDFKNFKNGDGDAEMLDVAFRENGKIYVNDEPASKRVTKFLMTSPFMRSVLEMAIHEFHDPENPVMTDAVRTLLRKHG